MDPPELKNKLEALLFASGRKMSIKELSKLCGVRDQDSLRDYLLELQKDHDSKGGSLKLVEDNEGWKLSVKEGFVPLVQQIVTETEITKSVMETLAVIAWKNPAFQSNIIRIRTNKAYDHLDHLEDAGYITRIKSGRTKKITLTDKFFSYFDLPSSREAREEFKKFIPEELRLKIELSEAEITQKERLIDEEKTRKKLEEEKQKQLKRYEEKTELDVTRIDQRSPEH